MRRMFRHLILVVCLLAGVAQAAPSTNATDDIEKFLADRGLISQMEQLRQRMSQQASDLVVNAMGFLGVPYRRGGNTAESGFDCSGFVRAMYEQTVGLVLPRRARDQAAATETIERKDLQPGDLVFFNTMRTKFSHVGIYLGDNKFIHSPKPGEQVRIDDMRQAYWDRRFNGARRVKETGTDKVVN